MTAQVSDHPVTERTILAMHIVLKPSVPNILQYLRIRFGILVSMYYGDTARHHLPHIHVEFGSQEAVIGIPRGELIEGEISSRALRKVRAWIELNEEALMDRWEKAVRRIPIDRVD